MDGRFEPGMVVCVESLVAEAGSESWQVIQHDLILGEPHAGVSIPLVVYLPDSPEPHPVVVFLHGPWLLHKDIQSDGQADADARREAREAEAFRSAAALISRPSLPAMSIPFLPVLLLLKVVISLP